MDPYSELEWTDGCIAAVGVVMRVTVLHAPGGEGGGALVRYFDPGRRRSAAVGYYAEADGEPDGRWFR